MKIRATITIVLDKEVDENDYIDGDGIKNKEDVIELLEGDDKLREECERDGEFELQVEELEDDE